MFCRLKKYREDGSQHKVSYTMLYVTETHINICQYSVWTRLEWSRRCVHIHTCNAINKCYRSNENAITNVPVGAARRKYGDSEIPLVEVGSILRDESASHDYSRAGGESSSSRDVNEMKVKPKSGFPNSTLHDEKPVAKLPTTNWNAKKLMRQIRIRELFAKEANAVVYRMRATQTRKKDWKVPFGSFCYFSSTSSPLLVHKSKFNNAEERGEGATKQDSHPTTTTTSRFPRLSFLLKFLYNTTLCFILFYIMIVCVWFSSSWESIPVSSFNLRLVLPVHKTLILRSSWSMITIMLDFYSPFNSFESKHPGHTLVCARIFAVSMGECFPPHLSSTLSIRVVTSQILLELGKEKMSTQFESFLERERVEHENSLLLVPFSTQHPSESVVGNCATLNALRVIWCSCTLPAAAKFSARPSDCISPLLARHP